MRSLDEARFRKTAAVKLSSAGLIWYHFGNELIERVLEHLDSYRKRFSGAPRNYAAEFATSSKPRTEQIFQRVYDTFMLELDAIDNGVSACDCAETEVRYRVSTGLCSRVDHLNSTWNEEASVELQNSRFAEAMQLAGADLVNVSFWPFPAIHFSLREYPSVTYATVLQFTSLFLSVCETTSKFGSLWFVLLNAKKLHFAFDSLNICLRSAVSCLVVFGLLQFYSVLNPSWR